MGTLVLAWVRNEKMMGDSSLKLFPVCRTLVGLLTQLVSRFGFSDRAEVEAWLYPPQTQTCRQKPTAN